MGLALLNLARKAFVARHLRRTDEGIEDVESHWRDLPKSVRQAFLDEMHAPAGERSHPYDQPDTRPRAALHPGERDVLDAVERRVGQEKLAKLKAAVADTGTRKPGYLKKTGGLLSPEMRRSLDVAEARGRETGRVPARLQVRSTTYRGEPGFSIVGTDTRGRRISVFEKDRAKAEQIRDLMKAGDDDATQKVWGLGKYAPEKRGPVVNGEQFAPGYTPEAAAYEQKTRGMDVVNAESSKNLPPAGPVVNGEQFAPGYTPEAAAYEQKTRSHEPGKPGAPAKHPGMGKKFAKDAEGHDLVLRKDGIWVHAESFAPGSDVTIFTPGSGLHPQAKVLRVLPNGKVEVRMSTGGEVRVVDARNLQHGLK